MGFLRSTRVFRAVMAHTCTVEVATVTTAADTYHPGTSNRVVDFGTLATSYTDVRLSWQPLDTKETQAMGEVSTGGKAGTGVWTAYAYLAASDAPATLKDRDSIPAPETYHRLTNIKRAGQLVDAGPYDIQKIVDMAGDGQMLKLELKRVQ